MKALVAVVLAVTVWALPARACDTALILLMDRSGSMTNEEFALQLQGTADALRSPEVVRRIVGSSGGGSIYARVGTFDITVDWHTPWTRVASQREADGLADAVSSIPRIGRSGTYTGMALNDAVLQFQTVPQACDRKVIDVSTDGVAADLTTLAFARRRADSEEITINVIAVALPDSEDDEDAVYAQQIPQAELITWSQEYIITGIGSFALGATFQTYAQAMRAKLTMELAASPVPTISTMRHF